MDVNMRKFGLNVDLTRRFWIYIYWGKGGGYRYVSWIIEIIYRSLCLLKLGEGEGALQDVQMAIEAGYPQENRYRIIHPKNEGSGDIIPANFLDFPPNFRLRMRF